MRSGLREAGNVTLDHGLNNWVPHFADLLSIKSSRLLLWLVEEVCASLPEDLRKFAVDNSVSPAVGLCRHRCLQRQQAVLRLPDFNNVGKKDLYLLSIQVANLLVLAVD